MTIEKLKEELIKYFPENSHRYEHSIGVMEQAVIYAEAHGIDVERCARVGLMHDLAKHMTDEEMQEYIKANNIYLDDDEKEVSDIWHGPIAADICKKQYGFDDEMCDAIRYHSTAKANMSDVAKVLFCADKTDKTRDYSDVEDYRNLALKDINECTYAITEWWMEEYKKENREPLKNTKEANIFYKELLGK